MTGGARRQLIEALAGEIAAIENADSALALEAKPASPKEGREDFVGGEDFVAANGESGAVEDETDENLAFQKLVELASFREHSTHTMAKRLKRARFSEGAIAAAIERATSAGIIDDRRYADMLIRGRMDSGKGFAPIWREIEQLGIDVESLDAYADYVSLPAEAEHDRAYAFLERHPTRAKNLQNGAYRKLRAQGFSHALAASVAREWASDRRSMES